MQISSPTAQFQGLPAQPFHGWTLRTPGSSWLHFPLHLEEGHHNSPVSSLGHSGVCGPVSAHKTLARKCHQNLREDLSLGWEINSEKLRNSYSLSPASRPATAKTALYG